jgi:hypothetical protein
MAVVDEVLVVGTERERRPVSRPLALLLGCALVGGAVAAVRWADQAPDRHSTAASSRTPAPPQVDYRNLLDPEMAAAAELRLLVGTARPSLVRVDTAEVRPVPYLDMRDTRGRPLTLSTVVTHAGAAWLVRSTAGAERRDGDVYVLRADETGANLVPRRVATGYGVFPAVGSDFVWVAEQGKRSGGPATVTGVNRTGDVVRTTRLLPARTTVQGALRGGLLLAHLAPVAGQPRWRLWNPDDGGSAVVIPSGATVLSTAESTIAWTRADECSPRRCRLHLTDVRDGATVVIPVPRMHLVTRAQLSPDASHVAVVLTELDRSRAVAATKLIVVNARTTTGQLVHDARVSDAEGVFTTWSDGQTLIVGSCSVGCRLGLWRPGRGLLLVRPVAPDGRLMAVVP